MIGASSILGKKVIGASSACDSSLSSYDDIIAENVNVQYVLIILNEKLLIDVATAVHLNRRLNPPGH